MTPIAASSAVSKNLSRPCSRLVSTPLHGLPVEASHHGAASAALDYGGLRGDYGDMDYGDMTRIAQLASASPLPNPAVNCPGALGPRTRLHEALQG